jgi:ribosomal protein L12E/L44/L45/RPP1/RPP2
MDWIFDNFQIVALVALAMASWFKSRMDAKAAEREEQRAREEMAERGEVEESDFGPDEPWQEVLTRPEPAQPPPLFRANPPPVPVAVFDTDAELKRQMELQERLRQARESKAVTTGGAAATRKLTASKQTGYAAAGVRNGLREIVRKRGEIRRAVVLREILGPPLALRQESHTSSSRGI